MTDTLQISASLALPLEAFVTSTQLVVAQRGSGKSYTSQVEAEELLEAGQQIVCVDPTGAWYGLRSSVDGQSPGYPIAVLGGDHGDVALEVTSGEVIADSIINEGFSAILDLGHFRKGQTIRFMTEFLETLYRRNREPLHLFLDEADLFAPQRPYGDEAKVLSATEDVVRRGRRRGLGATLITQRPQVINKNVISQVDMLTCLRMNHPKDIAAIKEWIEVNADVASAKVMLDSLPSLPTGAAWLWAPLARLFERCTIRPRRTFDSGATPRAGQRVTAPRVLAPVDIARLGKAIAATHEEAQARDPVALRKRIAELEAKLRDAAPDLTRVLSRIADARVALDGVGVQLDAAMVAIGKVGTVQADTDDIQTRLPAALVGGKMSAIPVATDDRDVTMTIDRSMGTSYALRIPEAIPRAPRPSDLPVGESAILRALIHHPTGLKRDQLTVLTGYKRSTRDAYIARLLQRGLVDQSSATPYILATIDGCRAIPDAKPLPTGPALRSWWYAKLPEGERKILEHLVETYPRWTIPDLVGKATGFKPSTRNAYLARLAARQLVARSQLGEVRASATLFEAT